MCLQPAAPCSYRAVGWGMWKGSNRRCLSRCQCHSLARSLQLGRRRVGEKMCAHVRSSESKNTRAKIRSLRSAHVPCVDEACAGNSSAFCKCPNCRRAYTAVTVTNDDECLLCGTCRDVIHVQSGVHVLVVLCESRVFVNNCVGFYGALLKRNVT